METTTRPDLSTFAARLALIRHVHGWNQREAAIACGLPPATWREWELHGSMPRDYLSTTRRIAERADIDLDWLVYGPDEKKKLPRLDSNQKPAGYRLAHVA